MSLKSHVIIGHFISVHSIAGIQHGGGGDFLIPLFAIRILLNLNCYFDLFLFSECGRILWNSPGDCTVIYLFIDFSDQVIGMINK